MVNIGEIEKVRQEIAPVAIRTPLVPSFGLSRLTGAELYLKLETLQRTGSFKIRGAYARLSRLAAAKPGAKVTAASAGNHAQGVALASHLLGLSATIFMPESSPLSKQQATTSYGARVKLHGDSVEDGLSAARELGPDWTLIHPFDDDEIICGQASIGLEIIEDLPEVEAVVVPVGGGGLLAGVATAIKSKAPHVKVIGVEPANAASATAALESGQPVDVKTRPTLADGTLVARVGERPLPLIRNFADGVVTVGEDHIAQAMLLLLERRRIVAEGAGALGLAAFLAGAVPELGSKKTVLVISGGNVDANLIGRIIDQGLVRSGRIFRFAVILDDRPGALNKLLSVIAAAKANVLHIFHDRLGKNLPLGCSRVELELETRGFEHAGELATILESHGYDVEGDSG